MKRSFLYSCLLLLLLLAHPAQAGVLKGRITDDRHEPLSFVNVFIKGTNTGTTCNEQGFYELRLDGGAYEIIFQYIGFKTRTERIEIAEADIRVLDISLQPESYALSEVNVHATAEDPAYPIMRQAMAMRKVYLFEPKEYRCRVYLKGMQRLTIVPKKVLLFKVPADVKPGIVYLSESLSELSYRQPNQVKEQMISSKVSGDNKAFSFNRAGAIKFNLYENMINSFGLSERGFVSPLASNAFLFYHYKLEGESKENGQTIFKIRLVPIREHDPVFRGHIYIVKDSWRLHSTDLLLNKAAQLEFVDTLYIKQVYAQQQGGVWMPVSQRFIFQFEAFGFRGNGYFVAVYSKYQVNAMYPASFYQQQEKRIIADERVPEVRKVAKARPDKKHTQDTSLFSKKYFNNEVLSIDQHANKTDDAVWDSVRPVPLSDEERIDYKQKDSMVTIQESKPYMDSMDRIDNKISAAAIFVSGYTYSRSFEKKFYTATPLPAMVQFNTVEGWVLNPTLSITKTFEDNRYWSIAPELRYGFASEKGYGKLSATFFADPVKRTQWQASGGFFVEQFNKAAPITPLVNSLYSLLLEQNYLKEYQKSFANISYTSQVINGIKITAAAEYAQRSPLGNHTAFTFNDVPGRTYTSNFPVNRELPVTYFSTHEAFLFTIAAEIRFAQKYISRPDRRYTFRSKYPALHFSYAKGIHALNSAVDFDKLTFGVTHHLAFNLFGESFIDVKAGGFTNDRTVYFMDYQHFNGNQTLLASPGYQGFQLLDYYFYSTSRSFAEGHFNHHFNGFFIHKIPLLRALKWQEVFTVNYLKTPSSPHYIEIGAGIEHIFKVIRADLFTSFEDGKQQRYGIVVGFGF